MDLRMDILHDKLIYGKNKFYYKIYSNLLVHVRFKLLLIAYREGETGKSAFCVTGQSVSAVLIV